MALALVCCIAAALRGARLAQILLVAAILAADSAAASSLAADQSARVARGVDTSSWVDDALPAGGGAAYLLTGNVDPMQLWQTEFWNDDLARAYTLATTEPGSLPSQSAHVDPSTGRLSAGGRPLAAGAVVTDASVELDGRVLARSTHGLTLFAYDAHTRVEQSFAGLYPDSWTKPAFSYTRPTCSAVTRLVFAFRTSPYAGAQRIVASQGGTVVADRRTSGGGTFFVRAPLDAARGSCTLRFRVTPWSPAQRQRGSGDTRKLGLPADGRPAVAASTCVLQLL